MSSRNIAHLLIGQLRALLGERHGEEKLEESWRRDVMRYLGALSHFTSHTNADLRALWTDRLLSALGAFEVHDLRPSVLEHNENRDDRTRTDSDHTDAPIRQSPGIEPHQQPVDASPAPSSPLHPLFTSTSPESSPVRHTPSTTSPPSPTLSDDSLPDLQYPTWDELSEPQSPNTVAWPDDYDPQHRKIVTTQWLKGWELTALGITFTSGPYCNAEDLRLQAGINAVCIRSGLSRSELLRRLLGHGLSGYPDTRSRNDPAWTELAEVVGMRPLLSLFNHLQGAAARGATVRTGRWEPHEDALLERMREELGPSWNTIGEHMGRSAYACRHRYYETLGLGGRRPARKTGRWTIEEEALFTEAVKGLLDGRVAGLPDGVTWKDVAKRMGGTRSAQQCRWKGERLARKHRSSGGHPIA
ncbi:hypothetical protein OF83DRAFT_238886 [Amylostereum chailletii]|nr:hypothetical protein OF83DRAFT_238886 [Amylostereum chailletii]